MTLSSESIVTPDEAVDWKAAADVADALGRRTLRLVAERNTEAIIECALRMARESSTSAFMAPRAVSYLELAVLVGHSAPERRPTPTDDQRLEWIGAKLSDLESQLDSVSRVADQLRLEADLAEAGDEETRDEEVGA
jgi:hypothetical protein